MPTADELIQEAKIDYLDKRARASGFLTLCPGEVYEAQYNSNSHVFMMIIDGKWSAWRETWQSGKDLSISLKSIVDNVPFEIALQKATNYLTFITKKRG